MELLVIPAMSGMVYNDVLSILSLAGCSLMFLSTVGGPHLRGLGELGKWGTAPMVFGTFFQISLLLINIAPERIGVLVPMPPGLVSGMFAVSLCLFAGWWIRSRSDHENKTG